MVRRKPQAVRKILSELKGKNEKMQEEREGEKVVSRRELSNNACRSF